MEAEYVAQLVRQLLGRRTGLSIGILLERDMMRPRLLRAFGWQIAHVLAKDWYHDPKAVISRLMRCIDASSD